MPSCSTGHPPAPLSPPFPADSSTGCTGPGIIPALSLSQDKCSWDWQSRGKRTAAVRKENTFQCQKTWSAWKSRLSSSWHPWSREHLAQPRSSSSQWLCLGNAPLSRGFHKCPKYMHAPQDVPRPRGKLSCKLAGKMVLPPNKGHLWQSLPEPNSEIQASLEKQDGWHCTENK